MEEIRFDTKIAVVLRDDLLPWQELNVTAFLMSGIAANPELLGEPYEDADGQRYLPLLRQPVVVLSADTATLARVHAKVVTRGMPLAVYTHDMFSTGHDAANRATVAAVPTAELDLVGIAVHGPKNPVDKALKGTRLHD
ncbi:DUF2000 domain-containing protein [Aeromicrobium sp. CnD17-E]|uniref:DUF2000 domain-containing protein n=1 Tax=Aeromicrobium sp. CnD17-E TaxID=2954487 RepID=UPI00209698B7|nr:DUF2000 domain-containing protein [Aeromicrobium sp. CnD17-E]MCO7239345.1 DUF2000 domain-containing protein [Aeromicrobium sp. CnD17-E]